MNRPGEILLPSLTSRSTRAGGNSFAKRNGGGPAAVLPPGVSVSPWLLGWFTRYARRYVARHFHALRISRSSEPIRPVDLPVVLYVNHASWWDPLVGLLLKAQFFPDRQMFAPIAAPALEKYKFFRKLGFFPVEQDSARGAVQFLRDAGGVLGSAKNLLAITPQSRFADVRERPVQFQGGLGLLASRVAHAQFVPVALEYAFWNERLPEILVRFGPPRSLGRKLGESRSGAALTQFFATEMQTNQDVLAAEVRRRNLDDFETLLSGAAGQGGVYDWVRSLRAWARGETFNKEHGRL